MARHCRRSTPLHAYCSRKKQHNDRDIKKESCKHAITTTKFSFYIFRAHCECVFLCLVKCASAPLHRYRSTHAHCALHSTLNHSNHIARCFSSKLKFKVSFFAYKIKIQCVQLHISHFYKAQQNEFNYRQNTE